MIDVNSNNYNKKHMVQIKPENIRITGEKNLSSAENFIFDFDENGNHQIRLLSDLNKKMDEKIKITRRKLQTALRQRILPAAA
jgi:hypothetical protein